MSTIRRIFLLCDGPLLQGTGCAETFGEDYKERTATTHRVNARAAGWHLAKGNRDLCPKCWEALQQRRGAA